MQGNLLESSSGDTFSGLMMTMTMTMTTTKAHVLTRCVCVCVCVLRVEIAGSGLLPSSLMLLLLAYRFTPTAGRQDLPNHNVNTCACVHMRVLAYSSLFVHVHSSLISVKP